MVVRVHTPKGISTGFSVHEQIVSKSNFNLGELSAERGIRTRGEAVSIELPNGEMLFVLVPDHELAQATLDPEWQNDWVASAQRIMSKRTPRTALEMMPKIRGKDFPKSSSAPIFVRFVNINEPKSIQVIDPYHMSAILGPGYRLDSITLQLTDDDVSTGIENKIRWIGRYFDRSFFDERFNNPSHGIEHRLRSGNFSTEIKK